MIPRIRAYLACATKEVILWDSTYFQRSLKLSRAPGRPTADGNDIPEFEPPLEIQFGAGVGALPSPLPPPRLLRARY